MSRQYDSLPGTLALPVHIHPHIVLSVHLQTFIPWDVVFDPFMGICITSFPSSLFAALFPSHSCQTWCSCIVTITSVKLLAMYLLLEPSELFADMLPAKLPDIESEI